MPRKTKSTSSKIESADMVQPPYFTPNDAAWGGFINIRLSDTDKEQFSVWWASNPSEGGRILDDLVGAGVKFGLSYDAPNQCYVATITGALVEGSNERYCVTTRAGSLVEVVALMAWKHAILAKGDYGSFRPSNGKLMNWG